MNTTWYSQPDEPEFKIVNWSDINRAYYAGIEALRTEAEQRAKVRNAQMEAPIIARYAEVKQAAVEAARKAYDEAYEAALAAFPERAEAEQAEAERARVAKQAEADRSETVIAGTERAERMKAALLEAWKHDRVEVYVAKYGRRGVPPIWKFPKGETTVRYGKVSITAFHNRRGEGFTARMTLPGTNGCFDLYSSGGPSPTRAEACAKLTAEAIADGWVQFGPPSE